MITIQFLAEWAFRSSLLILCGALLLRALRVKDPSIRLAAWNAMLLGSLAIPLLIAAAPKMILPPLPVMGNQPTTAQPSTPPMLLTAAESTRDRVTPVSLDWPVFALIVYSAVAASLLLRLCVGFAISRRLLRASRGTSLAANGIEIRQSDGIGSPVVLGVARPVILLPAEWDRWDSVKLAAVLAHERSHIRRGDPAVQLVSGIHRALTWHNPLSWFLHRSIVRTAEEASDDAAVASACDRTSYAEILIEFMRRGVNDKGWQGIAMARYAPPEKRVHRILDGTELSRGITRWSMAAVLTLGSCLAYVAAAVHPQQPPAPVAPRMASTANTPQAPDPPQPPSQSPVAPAPPARPVAPRNQPEFERYIVVLGDNSTSGSWNSNDTTDPETLRAKYGSTFAWFRKATHEYIITDPGVMAEIENAMAPQKDVNRLQDGVNAEQSRVNVMQAAVNTRQQEVNSLQGEVNRRQDLANRIQASVEKDDNQALIQKLKAAVENLQASKEGANQDAVNHRQSEVNGEQSRVNAEQSKVNAMQSKVNEQQSRVSAEYGRRFQEIFDSAIRRGVVRQLN